MVEQVQVQRRSMVIDALDPRTDGARIDPLLDAAFGTDRHQRTVYRLRAHGRWLRGLSLAARCGDALAGVLLCWPVAHVADADGRVTRLVLVGPVAVEPARQGHGVGTALMTRLLADAAPSLSMMMVGDAPYYARFGFRAGQGADWRLGGPVDPARLLTHGPVPATAGRIVADPPTMP